MLEPIKIDPDAFYDDVSLYRATGISSSATAKGRRTGTLRSTRAGGRLRYRGSWLLDWLEHEAEPAHQGPKEEASLC